MARRSTSTFAVLGLIGLGPTTPYELVQRMNTGTLPFVWPRATSKIYEEPKRLVAEGLATGTPDGRRTIYEITAAGRRWLRDRLDDAPDPLVLEYEGVLKVLFANHGTREQLLMTIRRMRDDALERVERSDERTVAYASAPPRPERAHLTALSSELLSRIGETIVDWTEWAEARVEQWDDLQPSNARKAEAIETMDGILRRGRRQLRRHRPRVRDEERTTPLSSAASIAGPP